MARLRTASTLLVLWALVAACSSAGSSSLSDTVRQQANAVCQQWTTALNQLGFSPPLADTNRVASFTKSQIQIDMSYTEQFKAVQASSADKSVLGPVYNGFDAINMAETNVLAAAQAGDRAAIQTYHQQVVVQTQKLNPTLKSLGLKACMS